MSKSIKNGCFEIGTLEIKRIVLIFELENFVELQGCFWGSRPIIVSGEHDGNYNRF